MGYDGADIAMHVWYRIDKLLAHAARDGKGRCVYLFSALVDVHASTRSQDNFRV